MAAGVLSRLWEIGDMDVLEAWEVTKLKENML